MSQENTPSSGSDNSGATKNAADFSYAEGRRYHGESESPYPLPNDMTEINRLDTQHYLLQNLTGKSYHAPIDNPKRVLDIGTGTGIWMREMSEKLPESEFLGLDIVPRPADVSFAQNCHFEAANILKGIPRPDNHFDFVFGRLLFTGIPEQSWAFYAKECARVCAPGGWVEMMELNARICDGGKFGDRFSDLMIAALAKRGVASETVDVIENYMQDAGLVDIRVEEFKMPLGNWGDRLGTLFWENAIMVAKGMIPMYVAALGIPADELRQELKEIDEGVQQHRAYVTVRVVCGRKS
ncbi:S-adenosyl-L-methionine-dependent methyltransferase [Thamnocephalis sphaerospora]|uniref:S-adenosyl-L-methionine-dependent methyltransferase n=1 Tax=Thamnocephalis sphaerospora TaxID=78915 RepID=A0A4P9XM02_9FUNG|nr:S-adenosyl-L-methionine-dependent methyltransferase [Thamnocephalis sphaerospora]|eukprot:RKP06290.1 S-adenosyl-L-methionine-dependent methyltransferase [Thamnocephalis sphaerospora]